MNVDALPLNTSGKVDRQALPAPGTGRPALDTEFVGPRTPVEVELANIWSDVLQMDHVGIYDSFFDLGGHSLLASKVVADAIKTFQVELPLKSLYESPTVADMAVVVTEHQAKDANKADIDRMLAELEALTDEQVSRIVAD